MLSNELLFSPFPQSCNNILSISQKPSGALPLKLVIINVIQNHNINGIFSPRFLTVFDYQHEAEGLALRRGMGRGKSSTCRTGVAQDDWNAGNLDPFKGQIVAVRV